MISFLYFSSGAKDPRLHSLLLSEVWNLKLSWACIPVVLVSKSLKTCLGCFFIVKLTFFKIEKNKCRGDLTNASAKTTVCSQDKSLPLSWRREEESVKSDPKLKVGGSWPEHKRTHTICKYTGCAVYRIAPSITTSRQRSVVAGGTLNMYIVVYIKSIYTMYKVCA